MAEPSSQKIAETISNGHAYRYHVLGESRPLANGGSQPNSNQFDHPKKTYGQNLNIHTEADFTAHLLETMNSEDTIGYLRNNGGAVFYNQQTNTTVIYDPKNPDGGTAFREPRGIAGFIENAYEKDHDKNLVSGNPSADLHKGGWDKVYDAGVASPDPNAQPYTDAELHQHLNSLGVETHDISGKPIKQPLSKVIEQGLSRHAVHGVGAASIAVDMAQGNYGAATMDTAATLAENHAVQEAALEVAAKVGVKGAFELAAKRIPVIGAVVTGAFVAYEVGAHVMDGEFKVAGAALAAGSAETLGNVVGFGVGDVARESVREGVIALGGDKFEAVDKSGLRELGEGAYEVGKAALATKPPQGKPVSDVLPANYRSMTQGADEMGDRSEVRRIALERTGYTANDPRNDMSLLSQEKDRPMGHLLVLEDGTVQGAESGALPFDKNPKIAAGKNGETLGVLYAGTGAMTDAQYNTVTQLKDWLETQRGREGITEPVAMMGGSFETANILNLPSPRGVMPSASLQAAPTSFKQRPQMGGGM